ncbi:MAG: P27 family phage terminase small subunit [Dehalococcoidia bacterium]
MAGARQKAPILLADSRRGRGRGLVVPVVQRKAPAAPSGLHNTARVVWREFWASPVSQAVDIQADRYALQQWIRAIDEAERLNEIAVSQPLIPGSRHTKEKPHLILNPLFRRIERLQDDIRRSQEAFGMTPLSRFRLQLTFAEAGNSMADLKARADRPAGRRGPLRLDDLA